MSVELGKILSGWETRRDVLVDELFARRAQALAQEGREPQALALLESRAAVHDSAFVARAQALLLGQVDRDDPSRAVAALRRAVADPLNPERATDLANLVQVVPILDEPEGERLLTELASDPTYAEAWWISRLRGMLAYRRATRAYAHEGRNAARSHAVEAARLYDNAIRGHESARKLAIDRELDPWPDVPASPILSANAYDAHHLAGHMTRAKRRHDAAMDRCIELANYAFEAALAGALDAARVACSRVIGVGWTADPTVSALTLTSVIADRQGDVEEARVTWQRARQIDAMKAALFRRRAVEALAGTAQ
jgi:tetratricopeptide (TPR) repeat protein